MTPRLLNALEPLFDLLKLDPKKAIPDCLVFFKPSQIVPTFCLATIDPAIEKTLDEKGMDRGEVLSKSIRMVLKDNCATAYILVQESWVTEIPKDRSKEVKRTEALICSGQDGAEIFMRVYPIERNSEGLICGVGKPDIPNKISGQFAGLLNEKANTTIPVPTNLDVSRN